MASNFRQFFKHPRYTLPELLKNCNEIRRKYSEATYKVYKGKVVVNFFAAIRRFDEIQGEAIGPNRFNESGCFRY